MSISYDPARVLQVACPKCDAQPGERCRTESGRPRNRHDYHATRKGIVYPEFATQRRGLSDPRRKANKIMLAIDGYVGARIGLSQCQTGPERAEMHEKVEQARDALVIALQEALK